MSVSELSVKKLCANLFIHEIVWYNPNWDREAAELTKIRMVCDNVATYKDWNECLSYLQEAASCIQLVLSETNVDDIKELFKQILEINKKNISNIYVYDRKIENQITSLLDDFKIFNFSHNFDDLLAAIRKNILIVGFPKFKYYDEDEDFYNYGFLSDFQQEVFEQFEDFTKMKLCTDKDYQIYSEKKIQSFIKDHSEYSAHSILNWYANDPFYRRILNYWPSSVYWTQCIRISSRIRSSLYVAVKNQSKEQITKYSGILYSEAFIGEKQWKSIQKKVGRDIVIDSFLCARKKKDYSVHFIKENIVFITIILPGFRGKWQKDFIDLIEFSDDHNRQEILFNALSEFRILEAYIQASERHLVLLFEANTLRKFTELNQTALSFVKNPLNLKCNACGFNISSNALVYIQMFNFDNICENCLEKYQSDNKYPLLRTTPSNLETEKSFEGYSYIEIPGILLNYDHLPKLSFYGYKCVKCNITASSYFTCLKCSPPSLLSKSQENEEYVGAFNLYDDDPYKYYDCLQYPKTIATICEECARQTCFKDNHPLILENYPYTFWSETILNIEYDWLKAFKDSESDIFNLSNEEWEHYSDEEFNIKDSMDKIVKSMILEIVWYEPDCNKNMEDLKKILGDFFDKINIKLFYEQNESINYLRKVNRFCQVIVRGDNFEEEFVKDVCNIKNVSCIYIPGKKPQKENKEPICNKIKFYQDDKVLESKIKISTRRLDFPMFCVLSDGFEMTRTEMFHSYLKIITFKNGEKPKQNFINLAKKIYFQSDQQARDIKNFQETYYPEDKNTLSWYTQNTFLYELVNNCLRLATFESVQLCKYFIHHLNIAIKNRYLEQDRNFNGILFRASFISDDEWKILEENVGKDIEMFGFLSTTKDIDVAKSFGANKSRALITVIVPPIFEKGDQGFADVEQCSEFAGEKEMLFNIMSRFTILEAIKNDKFQGKIFPRHLVLLYSSEELRLSASLMQQKPFEIKIINKELIKCRFCNIRMEQNLFYASLDWGSHEKNSYICNKCILKYINFHTAPLLCINSSICGSAIKMKGFSMKYSKNLGIPFYGYKCSKCGQKNLDVEFHKCLDCEEFQLQWCRDCFLNDNPCLNNQHLVVLETQPYSFWTKPMTKLQSNHSIHAQEELGKLSQDKFFPLGQALFKNCEFEKCYQYYHESLTKIESENNRKVVALYKNLAETCIHLGKLDEAEEHCLKSREILTEIIKGSCGTFTIIRKTCGSNQEEVIKTPFIMERSEDTIAFEELDVLLGKIMYESERYQEAIEFCSQILATEQEKMMQPLIEIITLAYQKLGNLEAALEYHSKLIELSPNRINSYKNMGTIYREMGKLKVAVTNDLLAFELSCKYYGVDHYGTADILEELGHDCRMLEKYQDAIKFYFRALEIKKSFLRDEKNLIILLLYENIGSTFLCSKEYDKAIEFFTKSIQSVDEESNFRKARIYEYLGTAYRGLKNYQEAIENLTKSLELLKTLFSENNLDIADLDEKIGLTYSDFKEYEKTIEFCLESIKIKGKLNEHDKISDECYIYLGQAFLGLEQYEKASEYISKGIKIMIITKRDKNKLESLQNLLEETINNRNKQLTFKPRTPDVACSYQNLGIAFSNVEKYEKAIKFHLIALEIQLSTLGYNHVDTAASYRNLGMTYQYWKNYQEALENYSKALQILKTTLGENHIDIASCYKNIGSLYQDWGKYQEAVENFSRALDLTKSIKEDNDLEMADVHEKLGFAYSGLEKYKESLENNLKCLDIRRSILGEKHRNTALSYENIGANYNKLQQYQDAILHHLKALKIRQVTLGYQHLETASSYQNLAIAHHGLKQYDKTINFMIKSLDIHESNSQSEHLEMAARYEKLGSIYHDWEKFKEAVDYHSKALVIRKWIHKGNHMEIASSYREIGRAYYGWQKYQEAINNHLKDLKIRILNFGVKHPNTASSYENIGMAYHGMKQYDKAIEFCMESLNLKKIIFEENHLSNESLYTFIGLAFLGLEEYEEANTYISKALHLVKLDEGNKTKLNNLENLLGVINYKRALYYQKLGSNDFNLGKFQEAIEKHSKALEIIRSMNGEENLDVASSYENIGMAYYGLRQYNKAIEYSIQSLNIKKSLYIENHHSTENSYTHVGLGFWGLGEYEKAIEFLSKALQVKKLNSGDPKKAADLEALINLINKNNK